MTWMTPEEEALWAAVGGLEAAYLMNPHPYTNSAAEDETALEDWMEAALAEEAAAAVSGDTLTHTTYLPLVTKSWSMPEARALWVTRYDYSDAASIQTIINKAAYANFNIILFQVRGNGDAYYRSHYEPWSERISGTLGQDPGWDPLATAITAAHQSGLELHAYINVYPAWVGETPPISGTMPPHMYHSFSEAYGSDWLHWDDDGPMPRMPGYCGQLCHRWATPGQRALRRIAVLTGPGEPFSLCAGVRHHELRRLATATGDRIGLPDLHRGVDRRSEAVGGGVAFLRQWLPQLLSRLPGLVARGRDRRHRADALRQFGAH
jgi:hypothetical protein